MNRTDLLIKAISVVLSRKKILIDSFCIEETPPSLQLGGDLDGFCLRTFSLTLTEALQNKDFEIANQNPGGRYETVWEQIRKEYDRLEKEEEK